MGAAFLGVQQILCLRLSLSCAPQPGSNSDLWLWSCDPSRRMWAALKSHNEVGFDQQGTTRSRKGRGSYISYKKLWPVPDSAQLMGSCDQRCCPPKAHASQKTESCWVDRKPLSLLLTLSLLFLQGEVLSQPKEIGHLCPRPHQPGSWISRLWDEALRAGTELQGSSCFRQGREASPQKRQVPRLFLGRNPVGASPAGKSFRACVTFSSLWVINGTLSTSS
jgi:hypothetical protein